MPGLKMSRHAVLLVAVLALASANVACAAWSRLLPQNGPTPTPRNAPTPTAQIMADCFWSADVFAWIDADDDGSRGEGEQPLAGVEVNFSLTFLSGETTGDDGMAHVGGMHPGPCLPDVTINVVATPPPGYVATTETAIAYTESVDLYEFGFRPTAE